MTRNARRAAENVPFMVIVSPVNVNYQAGQRINTLQGPQVVVKIMSIKSRQDGRLEIIGTSRPVKPKEEKK